MSNTGAKTSLLGFFFTDEKQVAESFGTKLKECELDFNNPFEIGYVKYHNHGVDTHKSKDGFMALREAITKKANKENWSDVTNEDILDWKETLINMGYDCLVINTQMDSNIFKSKYIDGRTYRYLDFHKMYIVFDTKQINVLSTITEQEEEIIFPESKLNIEVYHGTDESFDTFSQDYFNTKEPKGDYIGEGFFFTSDYDTAKKYGQNVIKANLNIENPLMIETEQDAEDLRNSFGGLMEYFKIMKENPSAIRIELEKRGYDGLIDNLYNQYAVFSPEQIKVIK